jgi:hypothetical protein
MNESPPGRAEASGSNAGHRENQNLDTQLLPDQTVVSNHRLLPSQHGVSLVELKENGRTSYRVSCDSRSWFFSLRYSAEAKVDRLIRAQVGRAT